MKAEHDLHTDELLEVLILAVKEDHEGANMAAASSKAATRLESARALHVALSKGPGISVDELARLCLETLSGSHASRSGPSIMLGAGRAVILGLLLNELAARPASPP